MGAEESTLKNHNEQKRIPNEQKKIMINQQKQINLQKKKIRDLMSINEKKTVEQEQTPDDDITFSVNKHDRFLEDININRNDGNIGKDRFIPQQNPSVNQQDDRVNSFGKKNNPYKILCLSETPSVDEIKQKYRILSKKYHPDKNGGDERKFKMITKAYSYLMNLHNDFSTYREQSYNEKRENHEKFTEKQKTYQGKYIDKDSFTLDKFNNVFDEHKMKENDDDGYGDMMSFDNRMSEPEVIPIAQNTKLSNSKSFNNEFNKSKNRELSIYREPQSMLSNTSSGLSSWDKSKVDDYTNSGNYTDYKKAHGEDSHLINIDDVEYKKYKNVDELQNERTNMRMKMTPEEEETYYNNKQLEQTKENERLLNARLYDSKIEGQFNSINQVMIKNK